VTGATSPPREVAPGVTLVDTGYVGPGIAASYVVKGGASAAVIETGTAHSVPRVLAGLAAAGVAPERVSHVVVTHVHLDHAAGAGALLERLPAARLVVHPRGARHMVDPSKLLAGAADVYGGMDAIRKLYGDVRPAPAERVMEAPEGTTVDLGGRVLRMLDTPGHAKHHYVVHDPATRGFFTGDTFGISYREFDDAAGPFMYPTTTPVQFDPPALRASVERMLAERPERMYLTHFGMIEGRIPEAARDLLAAVDGHVAVAEGAPAGPGRQAAIREGLAGQLLDLLARRGWTGTREEALRAFAVDLDLNSQGLEVWLRAREAPQGTPPAG
jgi:glyoxylase-like metal-dependent hydrolase (beta-lactamase superfamily II)